MITCTLFCFCGFFRILFYTNVFPFFFFLFYNVIYIVTFTKYISKLKNKKEKVLMHSTNIKTLTVRYIEKIIHTVQLDMRSIQCKCAIRFAATQLKCIVFHSS